MTIAELKSSIKEKLLTTETEGEASAMVRILLEDIAGIDTVTAALNPDREIEHEISNKIIETVRKINEGEPIQYILGYARFHGLKLKVDRNVLIPRPETSALVDLITDEFKDNRRISILDVCTGSGAIAVALANCMADSSVIGIDISDKALDVARFNAKALNLSNVKFLHCDVLNENLPGDNYDLIVSNPPYIEECEKIAIDKRVLDYEPHLALFVPDEDPLLFYRCILSETKDKLKSGGMIYFEINPNSSVQLKNLISTYGFEDIEVIRDFKGINRYIKAVKK